MTTEITQAFIMGAGFGTRMMPLTAHCPKPMVSIHGHPIIAHIIDHLHAAGVTDCVVNTHAHAAVLHDYLATVDTMTIHISHEDTILDTGGGLQTGLSLMPDPSAPFYAINGDAFWEGDDTLSCLAKAWNPASMDILLLLQPTHTMTLTAAVGDYTITADQQAIRATQRNGDHMFTGIRVLHPHILNRDPHTAFSFLEMMDKAQQAKRLYAQSHAHIWHHLSCPDDIDRVNKAGGFYR